MLLIFLIVMFASILIPGPMIVVLVINMIVVVLLSILQVLSALFSTFEPTRKTEKSDEFVSIIIPTYNEPPALVMCTIDALRRLTHANVEIIVIDNNTRDASVWRPVELFAQTLGKKFRFIHVDQLPGFKAGALNYAIQFIDPASKYIAVLDADYVVKPEFITSALSYFVDNTIALVQFPQQYRNCTHANQSVMDEYRHFFKIYMNMANHLDCVPSTGTVSVYNRSALEKINGFSVHTITEDADAGLRLYSAGYRGVYVDHSIGYGLIPYDIEAYRKQKNRWARGNIQSVRGLFSLFGKIPFRSWLGFVIHLTAWDNLNFLPFAVLAAYTFILLPFIPTTFLHRDLLTIASLSIFIMLGSKLVLFFVSMAGQKKSFSRAVKAFVIHTGLILMYSEAISALWAGSKPIFERTNKFVLSKGPSLLKNSYKELILGSWFAIGMIEAIMWGTRAITIFAFLISSLSIFSIYYVMWKIRSTKASSKKIVADLENTYRDYLTL